MNTMSRVAAGIGFAAVCGVAFAVDTAVPAASQPTAVATSVETAKAANEKAIKRSDVATVVRTGPTVADRARQASAKVESKVDAATSADGTTVAADTTRSTRNENRAPRADRN